MIPPSVRQSKTINDYPPVQTAGTNSTTAKSSTPLGGDWDIVDEYDPRWPNDYEKILKERIENRENEIELKKAKKDNSNIQIMATRSLGLDYDDDDEEYDDEAKPDKAKSRANASIAPPPSLMLNVEKVTNSVGFGVSSVAAKIMVKMGYREGSGLGREEQGISKALQVEKTSKTHGKIVSESDAKKLEDPSTPTTVVLLRNMVGPGEADEELEPETKEECSKYGQVSRCVVVERKEYDSDEDAVLIFVEFYHVNSAVKAQMDLNGRYFGGRIVKASFYDCDRFENRDFS